MISFKESLALGLGGIATIFIPAIAINQSSLASNPAVVLAGVVFAAIGGGLFSAYLVRKHSEEAELGRLLQTEPVLGGPTCDLSSLVFTKSGLQQAFDEMVKQNDTDPACDTCGFPTDPAHAGWHHTNCAGTKS